VIFPLVHFNLPKPNKFDLVYLYVEYTYATTS